MNYVSLDNAYTNTFMTNAFAPEYTMDNNQYQPSYEDIIDQNIHHNNTQMYCDEMASHIKHCPHCKSKLAELIDEQIKERCGSQQMGKLTQGSAAATQQMRPRMTSRFGKQLMTGRNMMAMILMLFILFLFLLFLINMFFDVSFSCSNRTKSVEKS